jgi:capsular exopolysaccharide synthesis family protein
MVAVNLATMCAHNGLNTVLLDLDLRCGIVARLFGLPESPGFTSDFPDDPTGSKQPGSLSECVRKTDVPDLSVLTSGPKRPNPQELLGSRLTPRIITELRDRFDLVIIDCAPLGLTSDPAVISEYVDKYLVVVRAGSTNIGRLKSIISDFSIVETKLMGYILNRAVDDVVVKGYKQSNYHNYGYGAAAAP